MLPSASSEFSLCLSLTMPLALPNKVARASHFSYLHIGNNIDQGKSMEYILKQLPYTCCPPEMSKYLLIASTYPISPFLYSYITSSSTVFHFAGFCLFSTYWCLVRTSCVFNSCSQLGFHLSRLSVITPFPDYVPHISFILPVLRSVLMKLQVNILSFAVRLGSTYLFRVTCKWEMRGEVKWVWRPRHCQAVPKIAWENACVHIY